MKKMFVLIMGMMFLASCATTAPPQTGFLGDYYKNLTPAPEGAVSKFRWLKPGVDFAKYKKVMVDYVVFSLAEDSQYKAFSGDEMKELGDAASLALVNAIKKKDAVGSEEPTLGYSPRTFGPILCQSSRGSQTAPEWLLEGVSPRPPHRQTSFHGASGAHPCPAQKSIA